MKEITRQAAVEAACSLDGWLNPLEAGALFDLARAATGPIVEIGSYMGRSTVALALGSMAGMGHTVYAIDPFTGPEHGPFPTSLGNPVKPISPELLRENLDKFGVNGVVKIIPKTSAEAVDEIPSCSVLFVDGNHDYEAVSSDFRLYLPKVSPGGAVMAHDVTDFDPGVPQAFDQYITSSDEWRLRGRVFSSVIAEKARTSRRNVLLLCPGKSWEWAPITGILDATKGDHNVTAVSGGAFGWDDFNYLWSRGLNAFEAGECTHVAMLHSDIVPCRGWIDILIPEMESRRGSIISAVVPIKDDRGVTTTAVGSFDNPWGAYRRFTMREILEFPETFSISQTPHPEKYLLINSGCWVADLRDKRFFQTDDNGNLRAWFDFPTRISRNKDGKWVNVRESEDWFFSRKLAELGIKALATRKVHLEHEGICRYPNNKPWGKFKDGDEDTRERWEKYEAELEAANDVE